MTIRRKADADRIRAHIVALGAEPWLGAQKSWWSKALFHFSDVRNVCEILKAGKLRCREDLQKQRALVSDIASPEVISNTDAGWKKCVRLYFRPRTPTQYNNEGMRPTGSRPLGGAHCPVPIMLMFDSVNVLTRADAKFTDGNLAAANPCVGDTANFFCALPFQKIYHDESLYGYDDDEKRKVIYHRHAEVIVPSELGLEDLRWIWCRSEAETETLRQLLPLRTLKEWEKRIGTGNKLNLFFRKWAYVETVDHSPDVVKLNFNPTANTGPFHAKMVLRSLDSKREFHWDSPDYHCMKPLRIKNPFEASESYEIAFYLDEDLACLSANYPAADVPF